MEGICVGSSIRCVLFGSAFAQNVSSGLMSVPTCVGVGSVRCPGCYRLLLPAGTVASHLAVVCVVAWCLKAMEQLTRLFVGSSLWYAGICCYGEWIAAGTTVAQCVVDLMHCFSGRPTEMVPHCVVSGRCAPVE
jgi:hypothetical protein